MLDFSLNITNMNIDDIYYKFIKFIYYAVYLL